jgi:hypothetical protein
MAVCLLLGTLTATAAPGGDDPGPTRVFVIFIDGPRYDHSFGATDAYMPRIWNDLRPLGAINTSFRNEGQTSTNPGIASVLTGTLQRIRNDGTERPTVPTLFEYVRRDLGVSRDNVVILSNKEKMASMSHSTHASAGSRYEARTVVHYAGDDHVHQQVVKLMETGRPEFVMVNFGMVDMRGHREDFPGYLAAIRTADSLVYDIWQRIQADEFYAGRTLMVVTNDHGRHSDTHGGFAHHGCGCEGCRHIMFLAVGPGVRAGVVSDRPRTQIDILPTIAALTGGFKDPQWDGEVMTEILTSHFGSTDWGRDSPLPETLVLWQNHPNPFNPSTIIHFALPEAGMVRLGVYDLAGRRVAEILNGSLPAGLHEATLDATGLPGGTYLYRLEAGGISRSRTMSLVK